MIVTRKQQIYAVQWNGNNVDEIKANIHTRYLHYNKHTNTFSISNSFSFDIVNISDWIVQGDNSETEYIIVDNETFNANYEQVKE